jgi:hypothetical protein
MEGGLCWFWVMWFFLFFFFGECGGGRAAGRLGAGLGLAVVVVGGGVGDCEDWAPVFFFLLLFVF